MRNDYSRQSIIAPYIDGMLREKRSHGYTYNSEELVLNRFDTYCLEKGLTTAEITRDFLSGWMERKESEGAHNQGKRISCVRQLLIYMASCGVKVYIPHDFCHFKRPLPHIFDPLELEAFFYEVDSFTPKDNNRITKRMAIEYRLLFRFYCCCGLRNNEAAGITTENVNLESGVLTIINAKGQKDRLVYLPQDLLISCRNYYSWLCGELNTFPKYFFPGRNIGSPVPNTTIDSVFLRYWNRTRYAGCSNRPTVHDFRFTFVVRRMNLWSEAGLDLQVMMPYLSRYLGHKSIHETFYYYYLVHDAYQTVEKKDTIAADVIPEVQAYE